MTNIFEYSNIFVTLWFVCSETSYSGDERRCHGCGTNDKRHLWKLEKRLKKKKSLKEMRTGPVKRKESSVKLTESEKKMFKEAFNTDKTRLEKRHAKYDKPANFLILVEDNVHYLQVLKPL